MANGNNPRGKRGQVAQMIVGFLILGAIGLGLVMLGRFTYRKIFPPPPAASVSLSAYFDTAQDEATTLRIIGEVQMEGKPVEEGKVRITVRKLKGNFQQSLQVNLVAGKFDVFDAPSFRNCMPKDPLHVTAEVWSPKFEKRLAERIFINSPSRLSRAGLRTLGIVLFILAILSVILFLWAFTGERTRRKNRGAIILSYCVILLFLVLPLLAPAFLSYAFPSLPRVMIPSPVGLIVTNVGQDGEGAAVETQWALNIGGYAEENSSGEGIADVKGGIVIPLYVLILSILGGAINMTRKVPRYQSEKEEAEKVTKISPFSPLLKPLMDIKDFIGGEEHAQVDKGGTETQQQDPEGSQGKPQAGREETLKWRENLLNQYMFLISAPFLAIATYYLLYWLEFTKVPVLVLVSFSVGLISEPILRRITSLAERFIYGSTGNGKKIEDSKAEKRP